MKKSTVFFLWVLLFVIALVSCNEKNPGFLMSSPAATGIEGTKWLLSEISEKWEFMFTPYFNANSLDVDSTIAGQTAAVDLDFSDLMDDFDVWGAAFAFGGRKGKWGFFLNANYVDIEGDFQLEIPIIDRVNVDIEQAIVDGALTYRIFEGPLRKKCYLHTAIDVWGGPAIPI